MSEAIHFRTSEERKRHSDHCQGKPVSKGQHRCHLLDSLICPSRDFSIVLMLDSERSSYSGCGSPAPRASIDCDFADRCAGWQVFHLTVNLPVYADMDTGVDDIDVFKVIFATKNQQMRVAVDVLRRKRFARIT